MTISARRAAHVLRALGARRGAKALAAELAGGEYELTHQVLIAPVTLRAGSSDLETYVKVIAEREYELPEPGEIRTVVDAGANIGLASAFFASRYPDARIIALEPESENFDLLARNTKSYPNVTCLQKALWTYTGKLDLYDPGEGAWGYRAGEQATGRHVATIDCACVLDLMATYELDGIDLLKCDIEGGEVEVFADAPWIDRVNAVVVELHDRFRRGCAKSFYNATAAFGQELHKGENVFVWR